MALFGHHAMSDLSPECALKQTSADPRAPNPDTPSSRYHRIRQQRPFDQFLNFRTFRLPSEPNQFTDSRRPVPQRGVAHVTDAGRDAVDAAARVTNGADADGEVVWF
jgi:hypothetical protein